MVIRKVTPGKNVKKKRSSAEKRIITAEKKRLINKSFKSRANTILGNFNESILKQDKDLASSSLKFVYSMMDKCVKRGIYKLNKASRIKSKASQKAFSTFQIKI